MVGDGTRLLPWRTIALRVDAAGVPLPSSRWPPDRAQPELAADADDSDPENIAGRGARADRPDGTPARDQPHRPAQLLAWRRGAGGLSAAFRRPGKRHRTPRGRQGDRHRSAPEQWRQLAVEPGN